MEKIVSATEAVRKFSDILNSVGYRGESYTIIRGGKPVASISPIKPSARINLLKGLKDLAGNIPQLGEEAERYEKDLKEIRKHQPSIPKESKWD